MFDVTLYDTTLRDGAQCEGINLSLEDKLGIAQKLDELGVDYIEGGYPLSNPKDMAFFRDIPGRNLKHARVSAFGSTRRAKYSAEQDPGLAALLEAKTRTVTLVGKSWTLHVKDVLRVSPEDNIAMIADSIKYMTSKGLEVIFDAEHFFDGYKADPQYALRTALVAMESGAAAIVLCDTNGGCMTHEVTEITSAVVRETGNMVGFHAHNDSGLALANSLAAVRAGATHVQGTINGLGERTGNADLCQVIPNLQLKMGLQCLPEANLKRLTETSRYVYEIANVPLDDGQPFVGHRAFAHKGGLHVDAMRKNPLTYEHLQPEIIGNERRILLSELSGAATILEKMEKFDLTNDPKVRQKALQEIQRLENEGYQFEAAEASFALLVKRLLGKQKDYFQLQGFRVIAEKRSENGEPITEATIKLLIKGQEELSASEGDGPVNALDGALRKTLERFYPNIKGMHLADYKVRVINPTAGTAARVCVVIESRDRDAIWGTVGVSENLIEASWHALVDSFVYKLSKDDETAD